MAQKVALSDIVSKFEVLVSYTPLSDEVRFDNLIDISNCISYVIGSDMHANPSRKAYEILEAIGPKNTGILIPGRAFDSLGTRHGRGGGWYDRFLFSVPSTWSRIGFCYESQLSMTPLTRMEWDQPVDYICAVDDMTSQVRIIDTQARKIGA